MTSVREWKRHHEMTLPSGNVARLKRVALVDLIAQGGIPDTLGPLAVEVATKQQVNLTPEDLRRYADIVNLVVKAAMVEPPVADRADDEHLAISEIDWVDRVEVFRWANGAASALRPFRADGQARRFDAS